jgi:hypothetical protein
MGQLTRPGTPRLATALAALGLAAACTAPPSVEGARTFLP